MRSTLLLSLITSVILGTSYWYTSTAHLCPVPIRYTLGDIDARFGLAPEVAKDVALAAEKIWEENLGRDLFVYEEEAKFSINFIYDERQQKTRTEEEWRINLDAAEAKNRALIEEVKELGRQHEASRAVFDREREAYDERLAAYNEEVEEYNEEGGAPPEEFAKLQAEARALADALDDLLDLERQLNEEAEEINELGEAGNRSIAAYNEEVLQYNEIFGQRETFTQGDFERDRINVYKFSTTEELTAVLAHEFGHALGIGHVEGEGSVMYYLMTERDMSSLSATDREAFTDICGAEPSLAQEVRSIIRTVLAKL